MHESLFKSLFQPFPVNKNHNEYGQTTLSFFKSASLNDRCPNLPQP